MTRARSLSQLANSSVFTVATNNRVGIGSEVPTAKLDVDGTLNVSGNATIGGVATYEDVTNVDSVGIVTARSGVSVPDGQKILLGTSNDLEIFHDGTHSYIKNEGSGNLYIDGDTDDLVLQAGDDVRIQTQGNENAINCVGNGAVEIYYDNSKKFETTSTGVSITGALTSSNNISANAFISPNNGNTTRFLISNASGNTVTMTSDGAATFSGLITANGNILSNRTGSTQTVFQGTLSGVTKVNIQADGSATFAGKFVSGSSSLANSHEFYNNSSSTNLPTVYARNHGNGRIFAGVNASTTTSYINADGSAGFAGGKTILYTSGNIASNRTDGSNININASSTVALQIADPSSGAAKVSITHAGAATFNNTVTGQQTSNNALSAFEAVDTNGTRFKVTGAGVLSLYDNSLTENVQISSGGSATFASQVSTSDRFDSNRTTGTDSVFNGRLNNSVTSSILANGSATFAGNVSANDGITVDGGSTLSTGIYYRDDSNSYGLALYSGGSAQTNRKVFIKTDGRATFGSAPNNANATGVGILDAGAGSAIAVQASGRLFRGHAYSNGAQTSEINDDGSASFGPINISSSTGYGAQVDMAANAATVKAQCQQTASSATLLFAGYMGTNRYFHVTADGSATFASRLSPGTTSLNDHAIVAINNNAGNGVIVAQNMNNSGALFQGYNGSSAKNVEIFGSGSATFAAQIYSNGSNAYFHANRSVTPGSSQVLFLGETSGSTKFKVTTDGTGTFAGNILSTKSAGTIKAESSAHSKFAALYAGDGSNDSAVLWSSGALRFYNTTERMRITSSGVILFGQQSTTAPTYFFSPDSGGGTFVKDTNSTNSRTAFIFRINASEVGSIRTSGSSTSYNTSSDHRLKENVVNIVDGITRVKQLAPKRFNFIADADTTVDGFLAHEAQSVVPEAVTGTKDEVDDDGNAVMQGIDQSKLVPLLTAALQEAIAEIESLKARVTTLEG